MKVEMIDVVFRRVVDAKILIEIFLLQLKKILPSFQFKSLS